MRTRLDSRSIVSDAGLRVGMVPGLGAKITSFRLGGGREWVAPPFRPLELPVSPSQDWGELDCSGWDECFPNIAASDPLGLPDHGEVWRHSWAIEESGGSLTTSTTAPSYAFDRRATVTGREVRLDYTVRNTGAAQLSWAWAQHPLLAVDEDTRLVLPESSPVRLESALDRQVPTADASWFTPDGVLPREQTLRSALGRAAKFWVEDMPASIAVVRDEDWIIWHLGRSSPPHVGLWINLGGWGDESLRHLAIEPAFGDSDEPGAAFAATAPWRLAPGGSHSWSVSIEVGTGLQELAGALED